MREARALNPLRRVPPAHSPLPPAALAAGLRALLRPDPGLRVRIEERLARRYGARRVLLTDSGTSALALALRGSVRMAGGREAAALPAYGCYDLVTAARAAGVEPVLYDVEPGTLSADPDSLARALETGPGAVVAAHLYGVPVDLDAMARAAGASGALLVEDAAQGVGASYRGRPLGAHGSLGVLSFGRGKGLTGGGGGALLAHDDRGAEVLAAAGEPGDGVRGIGELAAAAAQWALGRPVLYGLPAALPFLELGETVYHEPRPATRMPEACLAVLEGSWEPSLREAGERRGRAGRLLAAVRASPELEAVEPPAGGLPGYLRLPVLAADEAAGARLSGRRARRLGVMPGYPEPLYRLDACPADGPLPGAEALARRLFTLPVHGRMSATDLTRLASRIEDGGA